MKKQDKYTYPAILTFEEGCEIAVTFPDLPGCATSGENEHDAIAMGKEALGLHLWGMEIDNDEIPAPSAINSIIPQLEQNECIALIEVFMPVIRSAQENKSVNRTVTLPAWLNARAMQEGVNFSAVLQTALKELLGINS